MPRAANALLLLGDSSSAGIGCAVGVRDRAWREDRLPRRLLLSTRALSRDCDRRSLSVLLQ